MLLATIKERGRALSRANARLKEHFVGIDDVIDKVFETIWVWYTAPELLQRPTIVNLFGMTGCGKTDLVRRLVSELALGDRFVTVELGSTNQGAALYGSNNLKSAIQMSNIDTGSQGVLLIDEFHRSGFTSGNTLYGIEYADMWRLFSDGCVIDHTEQVRTVGNWIEVLRNSIRQRADPEYVRMVENMRAQHPNDPFLPSLRGNSISASQIPSYVDVSEDEYSQLLMYKAAFMVDHPAQFAQDMAIASNTSSDIERKRSLFKSLPDEILLAYLESVYDRVKNASDDDDRFVYRKLLIFVCGNLDGLFAEGVEPTPALVRDELLKLFKPEMVGRLGNNFIVAHELTDDDFLQVVMRELERIKQKTIAKYGVSLGVLDTNLEAREIFSVVKHRGFMPTQGVRPVISQVNTIVGERLPQLLLDNLTE